MLNIEESAGYQRIFQQGFEKGIQIYLEEWKKGLIQGWKEGRHESLVDVTISLLRKKFRQLPREYVARIKEQDTYALQQVIDNIFDIKELSELDDYLQ